MIHIAVVEDEEWMLAQILYYLESAIKKFIEIEYKTYKSSEEYLEKNREDDILILDISLPGISGIEMGKVLREQGKEMELIYLTSYAEYAAESYLVNAYQYILKENIEQRFPTILQRLIEKIINEKKQFRILNITSGTKKIYYKNIIFIHKVLKGRKYVEYVTVKGSYQERISIDKLVKELSDTIFILLDRGHIVNAQYIDKVMGSKVYLVSGEILAISQVQIVNSKKQIAKYLEEL